MSTESMNLYKEMLIVETTKQIETEGAEDVIDNEYFKVLLVVEHTEGCVLRQEKP